MRKFLLILVLLLISAPVFAQENVITIIRDDGSKEVIELGGQAPKMTPQPEASQDKVAPKVVVEPPVTKQATELSVVAKKKAPPKPVALPAKSKKPKPSAKPKTVQREAVQKPSKKPHRQILPAGEVITKEKALYIALAEAPPSRDVQVYSIKTDEWYDYSVMFKVEEGDYEVIVDGLSGVIKDSGYLEAGRSVMKPGHLPVR